MKKVKNNILFIDKMVAGKDFACYFLDNNLYLLNGKKEENFSSFTFENKKKIKFDLVFIFSTVDAKLVENLLEFISEKTLILTNIFQVYAFLNSKNITNTFIDLSLDATFNIENKLTIFANNDIDLGNFTSKIILKEEKDLVENKLSNIIINNAINSVYLLRNKNVKSLLWSTKNRKLIINLIEEQIKITNSVMLDVGDYFGFNYYKFLSGNNVFSSIKKHSELFVLLSNYKDSEVQKQKLIFDVEQILNLNYNKFVEINYLQKILNMLNNQL